MRSAGGTGLVVLGCLLLGGVGSAIPPLPTLSAPLDGGWAPRQPDLVVTIPTMPGPFTATEFEVRDPLDVVVFGALEPRDSTSSTQAITTNPLPDAGSFTWRARTVDDAGLTSSWTSPEWFIVDAVSPTTAATLTAELDGGALRLTASPITDAESGLNTFHFILSPLDQVDGGISPPGRLSLVVSSPVQDVRLGPGTWFAGVHGHDRVDNIGTNTITGPLVVPVSSLLSAPEAPEVVRFDGGTYPTYPYLPTDRVRLRIDAGTTTPSAFVVITRVATGTAWELVGGGATSPVLVTLPAGDQQVRVSLHQDPEVSDWSNPTRVFVDEGAPRQPLVTARRDGGDVTLSWPPTRDDTSSASGVLEYRLTRSVLDAGLALPVVMNVPDASVITTSDTLPGRGAWRYAVTAVDRAGNAGPAGIALVSYPPERPTGLLAARLVTNQPVQLSWDDAGAVTWDVTRVDAADAGAVVATDSVQPSFVDAAPEGTWSYEVRARAGGALSDVARLDGVVSDLTAPAVSTPSVMRTGARAGDVSWSAGDALSGLASVVLERETDGVAAPVTGAVSPLADQPPDGTHRYRVVATDLAGNAATSAWSAAFVTPGAGVQITRPGPVQATCGRAFALALTASEPVTWSLSGPAGIDPDSGTVSWTPSAQDEGTATLVVTAQAATSFDSIEVPVEVTCTRLRYSLGCGCDSGGGAMLLLLGASLLRRRGVSARRGGSTAR